MPAGNSASGQENMVGSVSLVEQTETKFHNSQIEEDKESDRVKTDDAIVQDSVPTDHGWAWMVCAACFIITFVMSLYDQVLAVIFVDVVEKFDVSVTTAAVVFTIYSFTFSAGSIVSTNILIPKFGDRVVIVIASIISSASTLVISVSPNIGTYLTLHLFKGLCIGSMWIPALGLLGHYFKRRLSLANSITNAGMGVALLVVPPFVRLLLDTYGFHGTLLIISGVEMQAIAAGMLLRPPSQYRKNLRNYCSNVNYSQSKENPQENCLLLSIGEREIHIDNNVAVSQTIPVTGEQDAKLENSLLSDLGSNIPTSQLTNETNTTDVTSYNDPLLRTTDVIGTHVITPCAETEHVSKTCLDKEHDSLLTNSSNIDAEIAVFDNENEYRSSPRTIPKSGIAAINEDELCMKKQPQIEHQNKSSCSFSPCAFLLRIFDVKLLSDWLIRLLLASTVFGALLQYIPSYIPTLAVQRGVDKTWAAMLLTICGGVNLLSSLLQGFVIDCKLITASMLIVICQFIVGTVCHLVRYFKTFPTLVLLSFTQGMFGGARISLMAVVAMNFVGVENLGKALGFNAMVATLSLSIHHPFLGFLRDATNGFDATFHYLGIALYISAGFLMLENVGRKLNARRKVPI